MKETLLIGLIYFGLLSPFFGQVDSNQFWLDSTVVITANRQESHLLRLPMTLSIMDSLSLARLQARSLPEALMQVPGVWMQKTNHGGGSPFVRGLTGNQTLLLIDGIRLNNSTYRYGPNQYLNTVDPYSLDRVEVLQGSGAVQYGSDALGGVVHLLTHSPEYFAKGWDLSGNVAAKGMSAGMERTLRGTVGFSSEKLAFHAGLSVKNFGDLLAGGELGVQAPSAYQERDADFKARLKLTASQELILAWQTVRQTHVGRYDQVAQRGYESYAFDPQNRDLAYARYIWRSERSWLQKIELTASGQQSLETRRKKRENQDFISIETDQILTRGLSALIYSHPLPQWSFVSGIEYYGDEVESFAQQMSLPDSTLGVRTRGLYTDGATAGNLGIFSLHSLHLNKWKVEGGIRYNRFNLFLPDPEFGEQTLVPSAWVGNLGLNYLVQRGSSLYLTTHTGFRAPNLNDLSSFGSFDSGIEVPTTDLKPERSLSVEGGYRFQSERFQAQFSLYHTWLNNLIARVRTQYQGQDSLNGEAVFTKANLEQARIYGAETRASVQLSPRWEISGFLVYTFGEDIDAQPLRRIPPFHGTFHLTYQQKAWYIRLQAQFADTQDRLSGGDISDHRIPDGGTPGWQIFNAYLGYQWKWLHLNAGLQNLSNAAYRMHGSGVDGYGRSLWLGLRTSF